MSARSPAAFTGYYDASELSAGQPVTTTTPSAVIDDQHWYLDQPELIISDAFLPIGTASGSFVTVAVFHTDSKDMCDDADVTNDEIQHRVMAFAWCGTGVTSAEVKITSTFATADTTCTLTYNTSTPTWKSDLINIKTNANEDTITVEARVTGGAGTVYVAGFGVVADMA